MSKLVRNILIGGTAVGIGAALIKFNKSKKKVLEQEAEMGKKYYELGANNTERKYIKLMDVDKAKIEKLAEELDVTKEKKKVK